MLSRISFVLLIAIYMISAEAIAQFYSVRSTGPPDFSLDLVKVNAALGEVETVAPISGEFTMNELKLTMLDGELFGVGRIGPNSTGLYRICTTTGRSELITFLFSRGERLVACEGIASANGQLIVSYSTNNFFSGKLGEIDSEYNVVELADVGIDMEGLAIDSGQRIFAIRQASGATSLYRINPNSVIAQWEFLTFDIVYSREFLYAFLGNINLGPTQLLKINPADGSIVAKIELPKTGGKPSTTFYGIARTEDSLLLGDVNLDGDVNLLDVEPFVDVLLSGIYQQEADINLDYSVNLLDVEPFVDLLTN